MSRLCLVCNNNLTTEDLRFKCCGNWRTKGTCAHKRRLVMQRSSQKSWRDINPRKRKYNSSVDRKHKLKKNFNMTPEEYNSIYESQGGLCDICRGTQNAKYTKFLNVDHDHTTGKVRGLLCHNCNLGLGVFKDNTEIIARAIEYLNKYNKLK